MLLLPPHSFPTLVWVPRLATVLHELLQREASSQLWSPPQAAVWRSAPLWSFMGCSEFSAPPWSPNASQPSFPHLAVLLSSFFLSSLSSPLPVHFFPFLKYIFPEKPPVWLRGSVVPCSGLVVADCVRHTEQLQVLLTDVTPATPPLPALCRANPMQCIDG